MNVVPLLVHPHQVGFVSGHQAPDATRRLINLIKAAGSCRMPSLLLSLLMHHDQVGFVAGCQALDATRRLINMVQTSGSC